MTEAMKYLSVATWVSQSFPVIRTILLILIVVLSIALVLTVLFQPGNDGSNLGAMGGETSSETFYSKNKSQTLESALKRLTVILAIAIAVLAILFFVSVAIYNGI